MSSPVIGAVALCALYIDRDEAVEGRTADWIVERIIGLIDSRLALSVPNVRPSLEKMCDDGILKRQDGWQWPDIKYSLTPAGVIEAERCFKMITKLNIIREARLAKSR